MVYHADAYRAPQWRHGDVVIVVAYPDVVRLNEVDPLPRPGDCCRSDR